jgi:Protein of unknown function (DUF2892)
MKVNVGVVDRMFRVIIGLALIGLTLTGSIGLWGWLGLIVLVTGIFSYCPAYSLLGIKTCKTT